MVWDGLARLCFILYILIMETKNKVELRSPIEQLWLENKQVLSRFRDGADDRGIAGELGWSLEVVTEMRSGLILKEQAELDKIGSGK